MPLPFDCLRAAIDADAVHVSYPVCPTSALAFLFGGRRALQVAKHSVDRPDETFLDSVCLAIFRRDKVLHHRHPNVRANASQDMPPSEIPCK